MPVKTIKKYLVIGVLGSVLIAADMSAVHGANKRDTYNIDDEALWILSAPTEEAAHIAPKLEECFRQNQSIHKCVGITFKDCKYNQEACDYVEASAWAVLGTARFKVLDKIENLSEKLRESQLAWLEYMKAHCGLVDVVNDKEELYTKRVAGAVCVMQGTAERVKTLYELMPKIQSRNNR